MRKVLIIKFKAYQRTELQTGLANFPDEPNILRNDGAPMKSSTRHRKENSPEQKSRAIIKALTAFLL